MDPSFCYSWYTTSFQASCAPGGAGVNVIMYRYSSYCTGSNITAVFPSGSCIDFSRLGVYSPPLTSIIVTCGATPLVEVGQCSSSSVRFLSNY